MSESISSPRPFAGHIYHRVRSAPVLCLTPGAVWSNRVSSVSLSSALDLVAQRKVCIFLNEYKITIIKTNPILFMQTNCAQSSATVNKLCKSRSRKSWPTFGSLELERL